MTKRLRFENIWAEGGTATDPDLDTTAPSFEADKYEKFGWKSEKPPEEWQNFLSQISDAKIVAMMFDGVPEKDASVTYPNGAVYKEAGVIKVVVSGTGQPIVEIKNAQFLAIVADLQKKMTDHLAADNPHQDTVDTLVDKTYTKDNVNAVFGSPTDPRTIVYHKLQMGGGVHGETPAQVGTLPTSGGTFTGPVIITRNAIVNLSPSKLLHLNSSTGLFELASGTVSIGIDGSGNCWVVTTAGMFQIMTEANYADFQIRWNNLFALPIPYLDMKFCGSISDADSVNIWTVIAANTPQFHRLGALKVDDNTITFEGFNVPGATTIVVYYLNSAGTRLKVVNDAPSANYTSLTTLLTNLGVNTVATHVERITCYPTLSANQKSMLV